jgi:translation initiation factor eIF-2B subunit alpha
VAAESYKFARWYPLRQSDLPCYDESGDASSSAHAFTTTANGGEGGETPSEGDRETATRNRVRMEVPPVDFTPSQFITLLFTDLGVLTPSAVSDELIRLYQ